MSTETTTTPTIPVLSIQEQLLQLKLREQNFEQYVESKDQSYKLEQQGLEQCQQALVIELKAIDLKRSQDEQSNQLKLEAFELKQQAVELKQYDAKLDLQRREDALSNQIEQHTANVNNDKAIIEQERLSLQRLKMANEQEKIRLLDLEQRIQSLIQQHHQITGVNPFESFHIEDVSVPGRFSGTKPTITTTVVSDQRLDLRGRQLKAVSKLVEQRYDDALRKEYSTEQMEQEIEVKRKTFEDEKAILREKIESGQFDFLSNGDDGVALGLVKYAVSLPLDRLNVLRILELDEINTKMILSMNDSDFQSEQFQKRIKACQVLKLDQADANRIILLSSDEWVNDSLYAKYIAEVEMQLKKERRLISIIKSCQDNSQHYGKTNANPYIEYRCPQLGKQTHINYHHYSKLIDILYSNRGGNSNESDAVNPYDPLQKYAPWTIFNYFWRSDFVSGKIPKLTSDLKLFFASPNITNGEWIQFHGPGTELYGIDPTFVLSVGSLCDPNNQGKFTSKNIQDHGHDEGHPSLYQVSIKWA